MSDSATAPAPGSAHAPDAHGGSHGHTNYVKIWAILLGLLVVSVAGPFLNIRSVTLITAFGIALVKAYMVAKYFMHIELERRYIIWLVLLMLALMLVMVSGVSPDVMKHEGHREPDGTPRWENIAAKASVERGNAAGEAAEKAHHSGEGKPEGKPEAPEHH